MVNSIGLPNKGLEGFLEVDLPQLAELPVPLIVSVMATSAEEFATAGRGGRGPLRGRGAGAERLLPERALGPDRRRGAGRDGLADGDAATADREAADREADAERRRAGDDRDRRRAGGSRRRLADQHAQGGAAARRRHPLARGRQRRACPARRCGRSRSKQVADVAAAIEIPVVGMGGVERGTDAATLLAAGAAVVAVGTASFRDPLAAERIRAELEALLPVAGGCSGKP